MNLRYTLFLACALALLAGAPVAHATQVLHQDLRALTLGSSDIVVGHVATTRTYWNAAHTRILTDVTVSVGEALKGEPGEQLVLTQLGGDLDGLRLAVPGGPVFRPGEEALLFVWRDGQGRAQVNGLAQGKFDITTDPATGERTLQRLPEAAAADLKTLSPLKAGQAAPRLRLTDMVSAIRTIVAEAGR
jgi:hypothetical protein